MTGNDNQPTASLFERCVTRREMLLATGGALAGVLLVGCGGAQETSAPPVAGSFVGEVSDFAGDPNDVPFVAVVATGAEAEGGGEREVRAYLCDGQSINEWFWGSASGNDLELNSDEGGRLEGSLSPEAATGTMTLADGESFTFTANLATGAGGLYNVTISEDGEVRGISEGGGRLEARVGDEPRTGSRGLEIYPITGAITAPDGQTLEFESLGADFDPPEEARWIVLSDNRIKGARKGAPSKSGSTGFTCPLID